MIKVDQFMEITQLHRDGHSIRDIARLTGVSRNTVRKVLRGEHDLRMKQTARRSKLDPYKDYLKERFESHGLSAVSPGASKPASHGRFKTGQGSGERYRTHSPLQA